MLSRALAAALLGPAGGRLLRLRQHRRRVRRAGRDRAAGPRREVRRRQERGRRPDAARSSRAGASRRSSGAGPTRSSCSPSSSRASRLGRAQVRVHQQIYDECNKHDILFLLEPMHFPYNGNGEKEAKECPRAQGEDGHRDGPLS